MNEASMYFAEIYQDIPKAVLVYDPSMNLVYANRTAAPYQELELPEGVVRAAEMSLKSMKGTTYSLLVNGHERNLYLLPAIFDGEPYLTMEVETLLSIPEYPELMQALRNSQERLAMYLNGIYAVAQKLDLQSDDGKTIGRDVRRIVRMSDHLDRMLGGIHHLPYRVPMDMVKFAKTFVSSLGDLGLGSGIAVEPCEEVLVAKVMPEDLEIALANLVSNAFRFGAEKVTLQVAEINGKVRISVLDDGPGVKEPEKLFVGCYRTRDIRGAYGLGYALLTLKEILKQQDGSIGYEREEGRSRFYIDLPKSGFPAGGRLAAWKTEPLSNSLSQLRIELSDYIKGGTK